MNDNKRHTATEMLDGPPTPLRVHRVGLMKVDRLQRVAWITSPARNRIGDNPYFAKFIV